MSTINALARQVQKMTKLASPVVSSDDLAAELHEECVQAICFSIELEMDTNLTDEDRTALLLQYEQEIEAEKTSERLKQERRYHRKYAAVAEHAKEELLRELEMQIANEQD